MVGADSKVRVSLSYSSKVVFSTLVVETEIQYEYSYEYSTAVVSTMSIEGARFLHTPLKAIFSLLSQGSLYSVCFACGRASSHNLPGSEHRIAEAVNLGYMK